MDRVRPFPNVESYSDYDVCLMLTELFLGKEDKYVADNLYRLSRISRNNTHGGTEDGDSVEETSEGE